MSRMLDFAAAQRDCERAPEDEGQQGRGDSLRHAEVTVNHFKRKIPAKPGDRPQELQRQQERIESASKWKIRVGRMSDRERAVAALARDAARSNPSFPKIGVAYRTDGREDLNLSRCGHVAQTGLHKGSRRRFLRIGITRAKAEDLQRPLICRVAMPLRVPPRLERVCLDGSMESVPTTRWLPEPREQSRSGRDAVRPLLRGKNVRL